MPHSPSPQFDPLAFTPEGHDVPDFHPWVPERQRANGWSSHDQRVFIRELSRCGSVRAAAKSVGKTARSAYALRDKLGAQSFSVAWDRAVRAGVERTRERIADRYVDGHIVPLYHRGKHVGMRHTYNDRALIAVLQSFGRSGPTGASATADAYEALEAYRVQLENWEGSIRCRIGVAGDIKTREERDAQESYARMLETERKRAERADRKRRIRERVKAERAALERRRDGPRITVL